MRVLTWVLLCVIVCSIPLPLHATSDDKKFYPAFNNDDGKSKKDDSENAGLYLEDGFQNYLKTDCTLKPFTKKKQTLSAIPLSALNALGQQLSDDWIYTPRDYSAALGFSLVLTDKTIPITEIGTQRLPMDALQDPETMLLSGGSHVLYSTNCTGLVSAAASADVDAKAIVASITAAASADYKSSTKAELGMIRGKFYSPFMQMYGGITGDPAALYAHLVLWKWHKDNPAAPATLYVLSAFDGYTFYHVSKSARSDDGSLSVKTSANYLGFVSGKASLDTSVTSAATTDIISYSFGARTDGPGKPTMSFSLLDSVDQIINWSKDQPIRGAFTASKQWSSVLRKNADYSYTTHTQTVTGIPASMCSDNVWFINNDVDKPSQGKATIIGVPKRITATSDNPPGCAFTIKFEPNAATLALPTATAIDVNFGIDTAIGAENKNILEIKADTLHFKTSQFPQLYPINVQTSTASVDGKSLKWTLQERIEQDPSLALTNPIKSVERLGAPTLAGCTIGRGFVNTPAGGITFDAPSGTITIVIEQDFALDGVPDIAHPETLTTCTVSMNLRATQLDGSSTDLSLPNGTSIAYPKLTKQTFFLKIQ